MKLSSSVLAQGCTVITGMVVALYNINYVFMNSSQKDTWDFLQTLATVSFGSYVAILVLVIWPTCLLFALLYKLADKQHYPFDKHVTSHYDFIQMVGAIAVLIITLILWFNASGVELPLTNANQ